MAKEILIGVSGGIACYKTAMVVSQLVQRGHSVTAVMTSAAHKFIGQATFEALTGRSVETEMFSSSHPLGPHIVLSDRADIFCIAPATADLMGKIANGLADDLVSTLALAYTGPFLLAPAMNTAMWEKPSVQRNVQTLKEDGIQMVGPGEGWLSCRQKGAGRMAEPDEIVTTIERLI